MKLLVIEASTYTGSACVIEDGILRAEEEVAMRGSDAERLMPAVATVLAGAGIPAGNLDAVVCGEGPGSFTSLRIAGSIAKGLAVGTGKPLIPISSLALMVAGAMPALAPGRYTAVLDALRGELYAADVDIGPAGDIAVGLIRLQSAAADFDGERVVVGAGRQVDAVPRARGAARLLEHIRRARPADVDGWEPRYGRIAEAQVKWEAAHGRSLANG
jgi:tRNA threonylcarbamoyladenosine biosynthesis protein TsaB